MGLLKAKRDGKLVAYRLDKAAVIVGSGENCNIRVPDAGLVTRHCQILKMENGFVLRDMSGDAGTFVNGKKVKEHLLSDRDLIQMGKERFTFSESEGENTARVAVSMAPAAAPAKAAPTARVAAPAPVTTRMTAPAAEAPRKTERVEPARTTARIASPPPAVEAPGRSTQRVNKGTQKVQKATGRLEHGTKKITARSAAAMGYQTSRTTFALPSTRKGKLIAVGGVLFILALGGILYGIKSGQVNPDNERAEMNAELAEIKKFKPDQVLEIDKGLYDLLTKHAPNQKYVAQRYSEIEREYKKVHVIAEDLRKANKEVLPFLTKYAALKAKPADLKAQAQATYDECKSLKDSYGLTVHGDKLTEILEALKKILEERGPSWPESIIAMQRDTQKAMDKHAYAQALKDVNKFGTEFKEKDDLELFKKLEEQRATIKRRAEAAPKKISDTVKKLLEEKKKDEALKLLQDAKEGLDGFPQPLEKIIAEIEALNKAK
jgi:pSer/pThr/pTyr-binding forkhead associated (FHA) protein